MGARNIDPVVALLDDEAAIAAGDPSGMLGAVASAGAQVRGGAAAAEKAGVAELADGPRPRVMVVAGMGGSAAAGDVLAAIAGTATPPDGSSVPIVVHRGYGLPGWVGPQDLVLGVSSSGYTEETLSAVAEAGRRRTRLVTVGGADSPLSQASERSGGLHIAVDGEGRQPRACIWSLAVPMLLAAEALGLVEATSALDDASDLLDTIAMRCRPGAGSTINPAKRLALHLRGGIPVVWGVSDIAGAAANRFACQLAENAKLPAVVGTLSEPHHNQVVAFDGPHGRGAKGGPRMHLVVLRDVEEHPQLARRGVESLILAAECGVPVTDLRAEGTHPVVRLASLVGVTDFASVYLALALGIDPTPVNPIVTLKSRISR